MKNQNQLNQSDRKTLYTIAFVFMIVSCCTVGFFILPLAWMIPLTVMMNKCMKETGKPEEQQHLALSICSLLFVSLIGGILAIVASTMFDPELPYEG